MSYATLEDLSKATGETRDGDERRLARASRLLDSALISAYYDTDEDELPTDPEVVAAFRDAVVAQIEWWREAGDELGTGALYQSVSLGPATVTRFPGSEPKPGRLCPAAWDCLVVAGLNLTAPFAY